MPNDHYIPRFLTGRWEVDDRKLAVFDFRTGSLTHVSSRRVFADEGLNSPEMERFYEQRIETPVGRFLHRELGADPRARLAMPTDSKEFAGLVGLLITQGARVAHARTGEAPQVPLETAFDDLVAATMQQSEIFMVHTSHREELYFTEAGYFPLPIVAESPAMVVPLSPSHGVGFVRPGIDWQQLDALASRPNVLSTLSVGVGSLVHRVVLPPTLAKVLKDGSDDTQRHVRGDRDNARKLLDGTGLLAMAAGLPWSSWQ